MYVIILMDDSIFSDWAGVKLVVAVVAVVLGDPVKVLMFFYDCSLQ